MNWKSLLSTLWPIILSIVGALFAHAGYVNQQKAPDRTDLNTTVKNVFGVGQMVGGGLVALAGLGYFVKKQASGTSSVIIPAGMAGDDPSLATFDKIDAETDAYGAALKAQVDDFVAKRKAANAAARQALKIATGVKPANGVKP